MTREITAAVLAELDSRVLSPVILFAGEFADGFVRLWTGIGSIEWDGETFVGGGQLLGMSAVEESVEVRAAGLEIELSGMPATLLAVALTQVRMGKRGDLWLGFLDAAGAIIADPIKLFGGLLDVPNIERSGSTGKITISYENRLVGLTVPNERRYTTEDQQIDFPGDTGFDHVPGLQDAQIIW